MKTLIIILMLVISYSVYGQEWHIDTTFTTSTLVDSGDGWTAYTVQGNYEMEMMNFGLDTTFYKIKRPAETPAVNQLGIALWPGTTTGKMYLKPGDTIYMRERKSNGNIFSATTLKGRRIF